MSRFTNLTPQELEAAFPADKGWRAQWKLLHEARRRGLVVDGPSDAGGGREGGLAARVLGALEAAAAVGGGTDEGTAARALLALEHGLGEGEGGEATTAAMVLSLIR